jgi:hypothetical protein
MGKLVISLKVADIAACDREAFLSCAKMLHQRGLVALLRIQRRGMTQLLSGLFNADGSVAIPGFYDGLRAPTQHEQTLASGTPFDADA